MQEHQAEVHMALPSTALAGPEITARKVDGRAHQGLLGLHGEGWTPRQEEAPGDTSPQG